MIKTIRTEPNLTYHEQFMKAKAEFLKKAPVEIKTNEPKTDSPISYQPRLNQEPINTDSQPSKLEKPKNILQKISDWFTKTFTKTTTYEKRPENLQSNHLDNIRKGFKSHADDMQKQYNKLNESTMIIPIEDTSRSNQKSFQYEKINLASVQNALHEIFLNKKELEETTSTTTDSNGYDDALTDIATELKNSQKLKLSISDITQQLKQYLDFKSLDFTGKQRFLNQFQDQTMKIYDSMIESYEKETSGLLKNNEFKKLAELNKNFTFETEKFMTKINTAIDSLKPLCDKNQIILHTWDRDDHNLIINLIDLSNIKFNKNNDSIEKIINFLEKKQNLKVPKYPTQLEAFKKILQAKITQYREAQF